MIIACLAVDGDSPSGCRSKWESERRQGRGAALLFKHGPCMTGINDLEPAAFEGFGPWLAGSGETRSLERGRTTKSTWSHRGLARKGRNPHGAARKPHLEEGDRSHGTFHAVAVLRDTRIIKTRLRRSWPLIHRELFQAGFLARGPCPWPAQRAVPHFRILASTVGGRQAKCTPRSACRGACKLMPWRGPGESSQSAATTWSPGTVPTAGLTCDGARLRGPFGLQQRPRPYPPSAMPDTMRRTCR